MAVPQQVLDLIQRFTDTARNTLGSLQRGACAPGVPQPLFEALAWTSRTARLQRALQRGDPRGQPQGERRNQGPGLRHPLRRQRCSSRGKKPSVDIKGDTHRPTSSALRWTPTCRSTSSPTSREFAVYDCASSPSRRTTRGGPIMYLRYTDRPSSGKSRGGLFRSACHPHGRARRFVESTTA